MKDAKPHGILYIEDNEATRQLMQFILEQEDNLSLTLAVDGKSGLDAARTLIPELIFLDISLPDMSGLEVLATLRQDPKTEKIPVIAVSGDCPSQLSSDSPFTFDNYLTKPIELAPLRKILAERLLS